MVRHSRSALLILIAWLLAASVACGDGDGDAPIQVGSGSSNQDDTIAPRLPTRTPLPRVTATSQRTPSPTPYAATCGQGGKVAAAHAENGRLLSPRSPEAVEPFDAWVTPKPDAGLATTIVRSLGEGAPDFGVVVLSLVDGRYASIAPERVFYAASLFKLTVLYEVYRQRELGMLFFSEQLLYTPYYEQYDLTGAPIPVCDEISISDALYEMITVSDNVSAVLLQDRVGAGAVNQDMAALGFSGTSLASDGVWTTARDMARLLELIARGQAVSPPASGEMLGLLVSQTVRNRIPAGVPDGVVVGNKTGDWENATHDVAIVRAPFGTYVITALSEQGERAPIAQLSADVYRYLGTGVVPPP